MQKVILGAFLCCLFFFSCNKDKVIDNYQSPDPMHDYYPLHIGDWRIYEVDSIVLRQTLGGAIAKDTSLSLVKEEVVDTFRNLSGELIFRIERFSKPRDNSQVWSNPTVVGKSIQDNKAIHLENNKQFIQMPFPPTLYTSWRGNSAFDAYQDVEVAGNTIQMFAPEWDYFIIDNNAQLTINQQNFDSLLLIQEVSPNLDKIFGEDFYLFNRYQHSVAYYKKGLGLVYKEQDFFESNTNVQTTAPWIDQADRGFSFRKRLIDWNH